MICYMQHLHTRICILSPPVCLLSTKATLMTISWLTAINNEGYACACVCVGAWRGSARMIILLLILLLRVLCVCVCRGFVLSMNKGRHSATAVEEVGDRFVLSVPTAGMEEQATRVGGCSGRDTNKWVEMGLARCVPGWIMEQGCGDDGSDNGQKRRKVEDSSSSSSSSSSSWAKNDPVSLDGGNRFSGGAPKPKKKQKHRKERWFEPRERRMRSSGDVAVGNEGVCAHMVCDVVQNLELSEERNHKVLHCQVSE
jgi:hypothetical protein